MSSKGQALSGLAVLALAFGSFGVRANLPQDNVYQNPAKNAIVIDLKEHENNMERKARHQRRKVKFNHYEDILAKKVNVGSEVVESLREPFEQAKTAVTETGKGLFSQVIFNYEQEQEKQAKNKERNSPGEIPLGQGSEQLELARVIYGEAREFWKSSPEIEAIGSTLLTRKEHSNADLLDVLYDSYTFKSGKTFHQYSCLNLNDSNLKFVKNPLANAKRNPQDKDAWHRIYDISGRLLMSGPKTEATHYWTSPTVNEPAWAEGKKPVKTVEFRGKTTRFYNLGNNYTPRQRSPHLK